jgi:hypothetical protein
MKAKRVWKIIICLMALSAFQCGGKGTVPENLIGVWETTSPTYADRFFEITSGEVIFGTGEHTSDTYPIAKIRMEKDPTGRALYVICYKNVEGQEYKFSFYHDPANRGSIKFKNQQEMVWTKRTSSPASN